MRGVKKSRSAAASAAFIAARAACRGPAHRAGLLASRVDASMRQCALDKALTPGVSSRRFRLERRLFLWQPGRAAQTAMQDRVAQAAHGGEARATAPPDQ